MPTRKVPEFTSIDDMAAFFSANDTTELELGEIEAVRYEPKRIVVSVRFDPEDMIGLSRLARQWGMDKSTLIRVLVKRFLRQAQATDEEAGSREPASQP